MVLRRRRPVIRTTRCPALARAPRDSLLPALPLALPLALVFALVLSSLALGSGPASAQPGQSGPGKAGPGTFVTPRATRFVPVALDPVEAQPPPVAAGVMVATFNVLKYRSPRKVRADMLRLAQRRDLDVVGWQEADGRRKVFSRMRSRGWRTMLFRGPAAEVPISWRVGQFELVSAAQHRMHRGRIRVADPFPARYVTRVSLRHRATGRTLTVLNTHVNHRTTQLRAPGRWRRNANAALARRHFRQLGRMWLNTPGRYVVGTGDFNVDFRKESRRRPPGGPSRAFHGRAVANWAVLGTRGVRRTVRVADAPRGRWLFDGVYASARSVGQGWLRFTGQRVLHRYRSDHLPVLVRLELR